MKTVPRRILKTSIISLWLIMMGWLLRYEAFPHVFTRSISGYAALFADDVLVKDTWMRLMFNGEPSGFSHTTLETDERMIKDRYRVVNEVLWNLNIMGSEERIRMRTEAALDVMHRLQSFSFDMYSRSTLRLTGERADGDMFTVQIRTGGTKQQMQVRIPDDTIVSSPAIEAAISRLKPGQRLSLKTFNPLTLTSDKVMVRGIGTESMSHNGTSVVVNVIGVQYSGMTARAWIDPEGRVLRQEVPPIFVAEACTARQALDAAYADAPRADVLRELAVKCDGVIANPRVARVMRIRLSGAPIDGRSIESRRQIVEKQGANTILLRIHAADPNAEPTPEPTESLHQYLAASPYIQSDNPTIMAKAREITKDCGTSEKPGAICSWVFANVKKRVAPGIPSAVDVLRMMEGDCNEHTYLFTALARSVGIPTKVRVGIAYTQGAFFYHAWPEIYDGKWIEMDPTFGQMAVDATHIALLEGELANQLELVSLIGRLRAKVLSVDE